MNERWLLQIDRQCLTVWKLQADPSSIEPEVGEHWHVANFDAPVEPSTARGGGFARLAMPIMLEFEAAGVGRELPPELADQLKNLARAHDAYGADVWALRRYGRFAAAKVAAWSAAEFPANDDPDAPRLMVALGDERGFAGVVSRREAGMMSPGPSLGSGNPLSRAGLKLVEALACLELEGYCHTQWPLWLELGAYPGGMTAELAGRGHRVIAVDVHPPSPEMLALPGVIHVTSDGTAFVPDVQVDALLSDINGPPRPVAAAVGRLIGSLRSGGVVIHTIKVPSWMGYNELLAHVPTIFAAAGVKQVAVRHLWQNRQEVTYLGIKH